MKFLTKEKENAKVNTDFTTFLRPNSADIRFCTREGKYFRLHIFGKKEIVNCAVCGKELGRYKYKPGEEWGIEGLLCSDCHIEKTKEFMLKKVEAPDICAICGKEIAGDSCKPRWQWEMEQGNLLCKSCFEKKDTDYNKKTNFCAACNGKLSMFYYHPKPAWHIEGNLCRNCWDSKNNNR